MPAASPAEAIQGTERDLVKAAEAEVNKAQEALREAEAAENKSKAQLAQDWEEIKQQFGADKASELSELARAIKDAGTSKEKLEPLVEKLKKLPAGAQLSVILEVLGIGVVLGNYIPYHYSTERHDERVSAHFTHTIYNKKPQALLPSSLANSVSSFPTNNSGQLFHFTTYTSDNGSGYFLDDYFCVPAEEYAHGKVFYTCVQIAFIDENKDSAEIRHLDTADRKNVFFASYEALADLLKTKESFLTKANDKYPEGYAVHILNQVCPAKSGKAIPQIAEYIDAAIPHNKAVKARSEAESALQQAQLQLATAKKNKAAASLL